MTHYKHAGPLSGLHPVESLARPIFEVRLEFASGDDACSETPRTVLAALANSLQHLDDPWTGELAPPNNVMILFSLLSASLPAVTPCEANMAPVIRLVVGPSMHCLQWLRCTSGKMKAIELIADLLRGTDEGRSRTSISSVSSYLDQEGDEGRREMREAFLDRYRRRGDLGKIGQCLQDTRFRLHMKHGDVNARGYAKAWIGNNGGMKHDTDLLRLLSGLEVEPGDIELEGIPDMYAVRLPREEDVRIIWEDTIASSLVDFQSHAIAPSIFADTILDAQIPYLQKHMEKLTQIHWFGHRGLELPASMKTHGADFIWTPEAELDCIYKGGAVRFAVHVISEKQTLEDFSRFRDRLKSWSESQPQMAYVCALECVVSGPDEQTAGTLPMFRKRLQTTGAKAIPGADPFATTIQLRLDDAEYEARVWLFHVHKDHPADTHAP